MKKYISLFSFIALFFIGMQHNSAQELERRTLDDTAKKEKAAHYNELKNKEKQKSPEHVAKVAALAKNQSIQDAKLQLREMQGFVNNLTSDQQTELYDVFLNLNQGLATYDGDNSKKAQDEISVLKEEASLKVSKILDEDQMSSYQKYLAKSTKSKE